jgi:hypothetical protein
LKKFNKKVNPNNDNGIFWIPIDDYIKIFDSTSICCQKIPKNKKEKQIPLTKDFSKVPSSPDYEVDYLSSTTAFYKITLKEDLDLTKADITVIMS